MLDIAHLGVLLGSAQGRAKRRWAVLVELVLAVDRITTSSPSNPSLRSTRMEGSVESIAVIPGSVVWNRYRHGLGEKRWCPRPG
jgi:hypothetical protein